MTGLLRFRPLLPPLALPLLPPLALPLLPPLALPLLPPLALPLLPLLLPLLLAPLVALAQVGVTAHDAPLPDSPHASGFSHATFDSLLADVVDAAGNVDYPLVVEARHRLDAYMKQLAAVSPVSSPERFATDDDVLAYWLNAYNACILTGVVDHYPIEGVGDVKGGLIGRILRLADDKIAFFLTLRFTLGGKRTNLFRLEHDIVRPFGDPRIHFALNCASRGCPPLRAEAYTGARLDAQLTEQTSLFLSLARGVRIEPDAIVVSSIFSWFRGDFEKWMEKRFPGERPGLRAYLEEVRGDLPVGLPLRFDSYDWRLNDATQIERP